MPQTDNLEKDTVLAEVLRLAAFRDFQSMSLDSRQTWRLWLRRQIYSVLPNPF
jgi:hypothetical protein